MNSKFLSLPLRELQHYLTNLEIENERLRTELGAISRFNCILENIKRSSNKGYTALQCIDRNKSCRCNEHLNGHLRRVAQEADIELHVWLEQYEKLIMRYERDSFNNSNSDEGSVNLNSPTGYHRPAVEIQVDDDMESEPELTMAEANMENRHKNHCTNGRNCEECRVYSKDGPNERFVRRESNSEKANNNNNSDKSNEGSIGAKIKPDSEATIYSLPDTPNTDCDSQQSVTPPIMVVFEPPKDTVLNCDWPNCHRVFTNEDSLMHHRRNHIRKSLYHCEYCDARFLGKEELELHTQSHKASNSPKANPNTNDTNAENHSSKLLADDHMAASDAIDSNGRKSSPQLNSSQPQVKMMTANNNNDNDNENEKSNSSSLSSPEHESFLYDRLKNTPILLGDNMIETIRGNNIRPDEYKRTRYSGIGRYRCPWPDCGYTPHFLRDLRRHMHKHTGDKKHKCDFPGCDFVSVWKTSLLQHQRKKHFAIIATNDAIRIAL